MTKSPKISTTCIGCFCNHGGMRELHVRNGVGICWHAILPFGLRKCKKYND